MEWLQSLYPAIRETINDSIPDYWPGLRGVTEKLTQAPTLPDAILPIISCKAVGGNPEEAITASAALLTLGFGMRIFDDLFDRDKPGVWEDIPYERTWNYASTVQNIAYAIINKSSIGNSLKQRIDRCMLDAFFAVAAGQDRDIAGYTQSEEEYWLTVELKSAFIYATACEMGAIIGTVNESYINSSRAFGRHLGRTMQILNDMESIWLSKGESDLGHNRVTFPLLYGFSVDHPGKSELELIVGSGQIAEKSNRIVEILDSIDTKKYCYWAALKEREEALAALSVCPDNEGKQALEAYITGMFGDIDTVQ